MRYGGGFEMVSVDVREVIVAIWWRGWELCSELGGFGSAVYTVPLQMVITQEITRSKVIGQPINPFVGIAEDFGYF